jgi:hypothetical protein
MKVNYIIYSMRWGRDHAPRLDLHISHSPESGTEGGTLVVGDSCQSDSALEVTVNPNNV